MLFPFSPKIKILATVLTLLILIFLVGREKDNFTFKGNIDQNAVSVDARRIDDTCREGIKNSSTWFVCYNQKFAALTKKQSLSYVLAVLENLQKLNPQTNDCHLLAHQIASTEVEKNPGQWKELVGFFFARENFCNYGFIHGVIEGKIKTDPSFSINEKTIVEICEAVKQKASGQRDGLQSDEACSHLMAHLLLVQENDDVPKSIAICRKTPIEYQSPCFAGVFMEDITRENLAVHLGPRLVRWNDETALRMEKQCNLYQGPEQIACWQEMAHIFIELYPSDPESVYQGCNKAPNTASIDACMFHSIGRIIQIDRNLSNEKIQAICQPFTNDVNRLKKCIANIVGALLYSSTNNTGKVISYCSLLSSPLAKFCFEDVGQSLQRLTSQSKQQQLCQKVPENFRQDCNKRSEAEANGNFFQDIITTWKKGLSKLAFF